MEIDDSTGLPKVPERYFWRVEMGATRTLVYVSLRKKGIFGGKEIGFSTLQASKLSPLAVLECATWVYEDYFPSPPENAHLLGDYPPNKLGNN